MGCSGTDRCQCDTCWTARRARALAYRKQPDQRFTRARDEHSYTRFIAGTCRCDICRADHNAYRRQLRARNRTS